MLESWQPNYQNHQCCPCIHRRPEENVPKETSELLLAHHRQYHCMSYLESIIGLQIETKGSVFGRVGIHRGVLVHSVLGQNLEQEGMEAYAGAIHHANLVHGLGQETPNGVQDPLDGKGSGRIPPRTLLGPVVQRVGQQLHQQQGLRLG